MELLDRAWSRVFLAGADRRLIVLIYYDEGES